LDSPEQNGLDSEEETDENEDKPSENDNIISNDKQFM